MFQYRQVLARMRLGDTDRAIARAGLMGRRKLAQLRAWLLGPAGNRVHGTTHEPPLTRFAETEREFLRPLPSRPPELAVWARVKLHPDCHVQFEKTYYSAAFALVRQHLWLQATETTVQLFRDHELVSSTTGAAFAKPWSPRPGRARHRRRGGARRRARSTRKPRTSCAR